jgi:hypothetical protein
VKSGNLDKEIGMQRGHVRMKAKIKMIHLEAEEHQRLPRNHQQLGEKQEQIHPQSLRRN